MAVTCHSPGPSGLAAALRFAAEGGDAGKFIVAHCDDNGIELNRKIAAAGSWVSIDGIGRKPGGRSRGDCVAAAAKIAGPIAAVDGFRLVQRGRGGWRKDQRLHRADGRFLAGAARGGSFSRPDQARHHRKPGACLHGEGVAVRVIRA